MSETITPEGLRAAGYDELAALYGIADEPTAKLVLAEAARRDRLDRGRAARCAVNADWFLFAHAQYLAADWECRGNLLSRAGIAAGISPWTLWSGPGARVERYASEELREFWLVHPRVTVGQYAAQASQAGRDAREAREAGRAAECDDCGYDFGGPQARRTCRNAKACARRAAARDAAERAA